MNDKIETNKGKPKTLHLDIDYYQSFLDDMTIPDEQKQDLLDTLWSTIVQFVDMGFGIHPFQQAKTEMAESLNPIIEKMIAELANTDLQHLEEKHEERSEA